MGLVNQIFYEFDVATRQGDIRRTRAIEMARLVLDLDFVERDLELRLGLLVLGRPQQLTEKDLRNVDICMLALETRNETGQIRR